MNTVYLDPESIELDVINTAEDGTALAYRISTWDLDVRDRLSSLIEHGDMVTFEIDPLRFTGKLQNETTVDARADEHDDVTFIVNVRIPEVEPVVLPNKDA